MLLERGIVVSYETIRRWAKKFGPDYARRLRRKQPSRNDIWHLDEVVVSIAGRKHRLWRAVDQDGYVLRCRASDRRVACSVLSRSSQPSETDAKLLQRRQNFRFRSRARTANIHFEQRQLAVLRAHDGSSERPLRRDRSVRLLPSAINSLTVPATSSIGTLGSTRC